MKSLLMAKQYMKGYKSVTFEAKLKWKMGRQILIYRPDNNSPRGRLTHIKSW